MCQAHFRYAQTTDPLSFYARPRLLNHNLELLQRQFETAKGWGNTKKNRLESMCPWREIFSKVPLNDTAFSFRSSHITSGKTICGHWSVAELKRWPAVKWLEPMKPTLRSYNVDHLINNRSNWSYREYPWAIGSVAVLVFNEFTSMYVVQKSDQKR